MSELSQLVESALARIDAAEQPQELEDLRVELLGKSGSITAQLHRVLRPEPLCTVSA